MRSEGDFNKQQYSQHYDQYLESNRDGVIGGGTIQQRVNLFKQFVPMGRHVFEIGSGGGDEALVLREAGFKVTASDYVEKFVDMLKRRGIDAVNFNAKEDKVPKDISAIYANAIFVHFSPEEIATFLEGTRNRLIDEKVIFASVLKGEGSERSARGRGFERDFHYYTLDSLNEIFKKTGYSSLYTNDDNKWIQIVASCK